MNNSTGSSRQSSVLDGHFAGRRMQVPCIRKSLDARNYLSLLLILQEDSNTFYEQLQHKLSYNGIRQELGLPTAPCAQSEGGMNRIFNISILFLMPGFMCPGLFRYHTSRADGSSTDC